MNKNILTKCIEELRSATPTIEYVLGMLETLLEVENSVQTVSAGGTSFAVTPVMRDPETTQFDSKAASALPSIRDMEWNGQITTA